MSINFHAAKWHAARPARLVSWPHVLVLAVLTTVFVSSISARASATVYNSLATFYAATNTDRATGNFEFLTPGDYTATGISVTTVGTNASTVHFSIATASDPDGSLFLRGDGFYNPSVQLAFLSPQSGSTQNNVLLSLAHGFTALGIGLNTIGGSNVGFALSTGFSSSAASAVFPVIGFLGVTSATPFDSILLSVPANEILNVEFVTTATADLILVPEPSALVLAGLGAVVCALASRPRFRLFDLPRST